MKFTTTTEAQRIWRADPTWPRDVVEIPPTRRVTGREVQHSRSGQTELANWPKLFQIAERARRLRKPYRWTRDSKRIWIGGYRVKSVDSFGNVRLGCQRLAYWDIVRVMFEVEALGVAPL